MQNQNWEQVKELLNEVLAMETAQRQSFLQKSNAGAEIVAEVESLLAFEEEAESLMHLSAVEFSKDFFDENENSNLIGQIIGSYKIVREIGYGGMGAVYLAERSDGKFEQKVALKLLKREMNTATLRRRFQQEQAILATLEHPHIARLLDTGTTDDKIPFIAMEYVEGLPIDDFCHKNDFDLNQRLDLFRKVCAAVNFAHRNLVVHRDLKPSNILVNDEGTPKLLDFGISKIVSNEFEQDAATVTNLGAMTPAYASPEQLQRKSVTTATDIYSLGVILYELLSGHRPFEDKEANLKDIYNAVLEIDPPPPSAMIETSFKTLSNKSEAETEIKTQWLSDAPVDNFPSKTEANRINFTVPNKKILSSSVLRGDIDNIILKALRKEPERRYLSADNFGEDIHRHQRGLPVSARPNTYAYRAEKFYKRNQAGVIAGLLVLLAVIGGVIATLWQSRVAQTERAKAERRFNDVRALANSFLFEFSPKIENLPGSTPARELLVKRALEYLDNLSKESSDDLELQRELAAAYEKVGDVQGNPYNPNIGDTKGALESYEKAKLIRQSFIDKNPADARAQNDLAGIYKRIGEIQSNGGEYSQAAEMYDKSLELRERIAANNPADFDARFKLGEILRARGLIPFYEGDNKKAIEYYKRSQEIYEKLKSEQPENPQVNEQYSYLFVMIGEALGWDDDPKGATKPLQTGLEMLLALNEKYPNELSMQRSLMLAYNKRAENYQDLEQFDKSVELFAKGLTIGEKMLQADPQSFQAKFDVAMDNKKLAQALDDAGKSVESLEKLNVALKLFQEMNASDPKNTEYPYNVANTRFSIGETYMTLKNYEAAIETFLKAKAEFQTVLTINPKNTYAMRMSSYNFDRLGKSYAALALKQNNQENKTKAVENFRTALENFKKIQADGNLTGVDSEIIGETEKEIAKLETSAK